MDQEIILKLPPEIVLVDGGYGEEDVGRKVSTSVYGTLGEADGVPGGDEIEFEGAIDVEIIAVRGSDAILKLPEQVVLPLATNEGRSAYEVHIGITTPVILGDWDGGYIEGPGGCPCGCGEFLAVETVAVRDELASA